MEYERTIQSISLSEVDKEEPEQETITNDTDSNSWGVDFEKAQSEINQALQLQQTGVSGSFTVEDMIGFADWCRNGLTNVEYSIGKIHEHLEYWIENYR